MGQNLENLKEKFMQLAELRTSSIQNLQEIKGANEAQFDLSKPAPGTEISIAEIDTRIATLCDIASNIETDMDEILAPQSYFANLSKQADQLLAQYQQIADNLSNIESNGGSGSLDPDALTIQSKNGHVNFQVGPLVVSRMLWKFPGGMLRAWEGSCSQAARSRGIGSMG